MLTEQIHIVTNLNDYRRHFWNCLTDYETIVSTILNLIQQKAGNKVALQHKIQSKQR